MSAGQAKPESQPGTDRLVRISDWIRVKIIIVVTGSQITTVILSIELI